MGDLDHDCIDHWQVQGRWHTVVEQTGVEKVALVVVDVLFIDCPADALCDTSLHLSFDIGGMDCLANVLGNRVAQNRDLARIGIDFNVDALRGESWAEVLRMDRGTGHQGLFALDETGGLGEGRRSRCRR